MRETVERSVRPTPEAAAATDGGRARSAARGAVRDARSRAARPRRIGRALLALLALAFALRLALVLVLEPERIYFGDTIEYARAAESLLSGEGFGASYQRPPLYPLFMAGVFALFPGELNAVRALEVLLGCLTVLLAYAVGREVWGGGVALAGAAFVAVHPYLVVLSGLLYPEALFTALLLGMTLVLLRARSARFALLAGLLAGAASLAKASGLAALPLGAAWLAFAGGGAGSSAADRAGQHPPLGEAARGRRRIAMAAAFLAGAALLVTPWLLRNAVRFGELSAVDARTEVHLPYWHAGRFVSKVELTRFYQQQGRPFRLPQRNAIAEIAAAPRSYAAYVGEQLLRFWSPWPERLNTEDATIRREMSSRDPRMVVEDHPAERARRHGRVVGALLLPYYAFAALGVWLSRDRLRRASLPLLLILGFTFGYAVFFAKLRYRLPIEPYVALFAAAGALGAAQRLRGRASRATVER